MSVQVKENLSLQESLASPKVVPAEIVTPKVNKTTNIKEYKKEHYQKNKGYILTFHKQRVKCEKCGKDLAYSSKSSHLKNNRCKFITDLVINIVPPKPDGRPDDKISDLDFPTPSLLSTDF
jgi:ribosomal protein S27AE